MSTIRICFTISVLFAISGCGGVRTDYSSVDLAKVSGEVSLEGQPLAGATIVFEAPDQTSSSAITDDSGTYQLMFNSDKAGVTPGPKVVRIRSSSPIDSDDFEENEEGQMVAEPERIPPCYNTESQLHVTVEDGSQKFNFDLKTDCSTKGPTS